MSLFRLQSIYIVGGTALLPLMPFLYLQGQYMRRKIGRLPDASGPTTGRTGDGDSPARLLVLGESTAAGVGASTHDNALSGHFSRSLSEKVGQPVDWTVVGRSGITVGETIVELVPQIPEIEFDYILLALCGNEVLKLRSPRETRRDMTRLIGILREKSPRATFFITNAPAIRLSPVLPDPLRSVLGYLSALHDANARDFTAGLERVYYYHQPTFAPEGFFADGIHPSEFGYQMWSENMIKFFEERYGW
ncbi:MAG: SGNH/GDSL hydrolase family protein [Acidobacteria bacterium]|nr:SGNH/GDSL hydrolase family protein [Acidobacteriota bacterium]